MSSNRLVQTSSATTTPRFRNLPTNLPTRPDTYVSDANKPSASAWPDDESWRRVSVPPSQPSVRPFEPEAGTPPTPENHEGVGGELGEEAGLVVAGAVEGKVVEAGVEVELDGVPRSLGVG
ncbi:hypothetical protein GCM10027068_40150 [Prescottella soli]